MEEPRAQNITCSGIRHSGKREVFELTEWCVWRRSFSTTLLCTNLRTSSQSSSCWDFKLPSLKLLCSSLAGDGMGIFLLSKTFSSCTLCRVIMWMRTTAVLHVSWNHAVWQKVWLIYRHWILAHRWHSQTPDQPGRDATKGLNFHFMVCFWLAAPVQHTGHLILWWLCQHACWQRVGPVPSWLMAEAGHKTLLLVAAVHWQKRDGRSSPRVCGCKEQWLLMSLSLSSDAFFSPD